MSLHLRTLFVGERLFAAAAVVDVDDLLRCCAATAAAAAAFLSWVEAWCTVDGVRRHLLGAAGAAAAVAEPVI